MNKIIKKKKNGSFFLESRKIPRKNKTKSVTEKERKKKKIKMLNQKNQTTKLKQRVNTILFK